MKASTIGSLTLAAAMLFSLAPTTRAADAPCLPPGIGMDVLGWQTENARAVALPTESGRTRAALIERFRANDGRTVLMVWVRGDVVYVDTAPDNEQAPGWIDAGRLSSDGSSLLDRPGAPCQWRVLGGVSL